MFLSCFAEHPNVTLLPASTSFDSGCVIHVRFDCFLVGGEAVVLSKKNNNCKLTLIVLMCCAFFIAEIDYEQSLSAQ